MILSFEVACGISERVCASMATGERGSIVEIEIIANNHENSGLELLPLLSLILHTHSRSSDPSALTRVAASGIALISICDNTRAIDKRQSNAIRHLATCHCCCRTPYVTHPYLTPGLTPCPRSRLGYHLTTNSHKHGAMLARAGRGCSATGCERC